VQRGWSGWRARAAACAVALASIVVAGCGGSGATASGQPSPAQPAVTEARGTATAAGASTAAPAATTGSPLTACVAQVLDGLTLAQQVGQLFMVAVDGDTVGTQLTDAEQRYHFGSFLLTASSAGTAALATQTAAMQRLAASSTSGVRFFIAANQEGGEIQQLTGSGFTTIPSALDQGGWSVSTLRSAATGWGTDLRAAGVNLDLAPVMDVVPAATAAGNAPIGALDREFGSTPAGNGDHGAAFIAGMANAGVATVAKHFPGLGQVAGNTDFTADVVDNVTTADSPDLNSFRTAVSAGVPMVMVALATYTKIDPGRLAVFSPTIMRLLRDNLGFGGVIVSDDLGDAAAVQGISPGTRATGFLDAGGDLITSQSLAPAEQMAAALVARASADSAFRAIVSAAARQVLTAKRTAGLLSC
jgi:beta-N-acetylhexosaminidase